MAEKLRAPAGLGAAGRKLWVDVTRTFELSAAELALLSAACRQTDAIAMLEAVVADEGVIVAGSRGQSRVHGALAEARLGRQTLARLLDSLRLPADEGEVAPHVSSRSRQAAVAANARWGRERQLREGRLDGA